MPSAPGSRLQLGPPAPALAFATRGSTNLGLGTLVLSTAHATSSLLQHPRTLLHWEPQPAWSGWELAALASFPDQDHAAERQVLGSE